MLNHESVGERRRQELDFLDLNERIIIEPSCPFVRLFNHVIPGDGRDNVFRADSKT